MSTDKTYLENLYEIVHEKFNSLFSYSQNLNQVYLHCLNADYRSDLEQDFINFIYKHPELVQ